MLKKLFIYGINKRNNSLTGFPVIKEEEEFYVTTMNRKIPKNLPWVFNMEDVKTFDFPIELDSGRNFL